MIRRLTTIIILGSLFCVLVSNCLSLINFLFLQTTTYPTKFCRVWSWNSLLTFWSWFAFEFLTSRRSLNCFLFYICWLLFWVQVIRNYLIALDRRATCCCGSTFIFATWRITFKSLYSLFLSIAVFWLSCLLLFHVTSSTSTRHNVRQWSFRCHVSVVNIVVVSAWHYSFLIVSNKRWRPNSSCSFSLDHRCRRCFFSDGWSYSSSSSKVKILCSYNFFFC